MKTFVSAHKLVQIIILIVIGIVVNRLLADLAIYFKLPLYLDSIGTIVVAVIGGFSPGAIVGFLTNFIGGFVDSSTYYYGTINVMIAVCAGIAARRGAFHHVSRLPMLLGMLMILSIPCSVLSYFLFDFKIAENVVTPIATALHEGGLPVLLSQILADFCTEIPDKSISILVAYVLIHLTPRWFVKAFDSVSGRSHEDRYRSKNEIHTLKAQVTALLFVSSFALAVVATAVAYKTYSEAEIHETTLLAESVNRLVSDAIQNADSTTLHEYIHELFCTKIFSTLFGLLLAIVFTAILIANRRVVYPIHEMTLEMDNFAYDSSEGRRTSIDQIKGLEVVTGNEIENLHSAIIKAVEEIDLYINKSEYQAASIAALQTNIITVLGDMVENRDETTGGHVRRTAAYAELIARQLQRDGKEPEIDDAFVSTIAVAAPLHDIGKINISDVILNKPGKLTDEEFAEMKKHTVYGRDMLVRASKNLGETAYLKMAKEIAYSHHEWWDGSRGYPERLKGKDIPLSARIMAVADVYDALVSERPYKKAFSVDEAFRIVTEDSGTHFDPEVVDAFVKNRETVEQIMKTKFED